MFNGQIFCVTGKLSVPRKEIESNIKSHGGKVSSTVTAKTTYLVATPNEISSAKYVKAESNSIPIVAEGYLEACETAGSLVDVTNYLVGSSSSSSKKSTKKAVKKAPPTRKAATKKKATTKPNTAPHPAKKARLAASSGALKQIATDSVAASMLGGAKVVGEFSCTLNQTNLGAANNNKFYIIQLLQVGANFYEFSRWGRVGASGQTRPNGPMTLASATAAFKSKFKSKTKNNWDQRESFVKFTGKYELIETEQDSSVAAEQVKLSGAAAKAQAAALAKAAKLPSKLDSTTQDLVQWILDADMFKSAMADFKIDTQKCPLGAITKNQVAKGYEVLQQIDQLLTTGKVDGKGKKLTAAKQRAEVAELSGRFYTVIPHACGMQRPPLIDSEEMLKSKFDLVSMLGDIEIAQGLQAGSSSSDAVAAPVNPIDKKYDQLSTGLDLVSRSSREFKMVQKYIDATKSSGWSGSNIKMLDMWAVDREGEGDRFAEHDGLGNRRLLWHGTNVAVVAAILKTGLRIMPTASSGSRVGRGIYLASENGKSAGYCRTARVAGGKNHAVMFLCEAAMGESKEIQRDDWTLTEAPAGYDSVVAKGTQEPDPAKDASLTIDGRKVLVPQGKPVPTGVQSSFHQSEYLVYKESQCRIRYMLRCEF